jgi:hypothetical protein
MKQLSVGLHVVVHCLHSTYKMHEEVRGKAICPLWAMHEEGPIVMYMTTLGWKKNPPLWFLFFSSLHFLLVWTRYT